MTSELIPSTEESSTSTGQETTYFTSFTSTLTNEISLSSSPDTFFTTDSTSDTSTFDLITSLATKYMSTPDPTPSVKEETTSEIFISSTLTNEITDSTELSKPTTLTVSTQIFQTNSMSELPTSSSSTKEFMTTLTSFSNGISLSTSTTNKPLNLFEDLCPNTQKTISCASVGGKIQLTDAFIGISSATPPVCVYNKLDNLIF